jgi:hypothetical protein
MLRKSGDEDGIGIPRTTIPSSVTEPEFEGSYGPRRDASSSVGQRAVRALSAVTTGARRRSYRRDINSMASHAAEPGRAPAQKDRTPRQRCRASARAPWRSIARPTALETTPIASSATVKPRKTKPRLQPVSRLIGPREDSEAVVAGSPGPDLRDAQGENRAHHGIAKSREASGALVSVRCVTHKPRPATRTRLPVPMSLAK